MAILLPTAFNNLGSVSVGSRGIRQIYMGSHLVWPPANQSILEVNYWDQYGNKHSVMVVAIEGQTNRYSNINDPIPAYPTTMISNGNPILQQYSDANNIYFGGVWMPNVYYIGGDYKYNPTALGDTISPDYDLNFPEEFHNYLTTTLSTYLTKTNGTRGSIYSALRTAASAAETLYISKFEVKGFNSYGYVGAIAHMPSSSGAWNACYNKFGHAGNYPYKYSDTAGTEYRGDYSTVQINYQPYNSTSVAQLPVYGYQGVENPYYMTNTDGNASNGILTTTTFSFYIPLGENTYKEKQVDLYFVNYTKMPKSITFRLGSGVSSSVVSLDVDGTSINFGSGTTKTISLRYGQSVNITSTDGNDYWVRSLGGYTIDYADVYDGTTYEITQYPN